jgi:hypothetical protein
MPPRRATSSRTAVDGLAAGAYVVSGDGRGLECLRAGDFRNEAGFLGLGQELPATRRSRSIGWSISTRSSRGSATGAIGSHSSRPPSPVARTYLVAYAIGLGATGLTFFDDDVTRFFSPHAAGKSVMFHMASAVAEGARAA